MAKTYIATEETQSAIRTLISAINNKIVAGGNSSNCIYPHATVTTVTGSTVTATNGSIVLTATEEGTTGIYQFNLPHLGTWTLTAAKDGTTTTKKLNVEMVKEYTINMSEGSSEDPSGDTPVEPTTPIYRYGYRISKSEGNPSARVEYLFDAVGLEPAHMDFSTGVFDYGGWADKWFITDNKPLMLKSDGTVGYYLNPNDYSKKEDGTASDIENTSYDGNAMAQFPLCWIKRYEDDNYLYEIISNVQYDEDYKAYAHTRADGSIADYFYYSMFEGYSDGNKIRSLSNCSIYTNQTAQTEVDLCKANGTGWYTHTWSQRELIRTLFILMGKSTNTQEVFGNGNNCQGPQSSMLKTGTLTDKGQFYGYSDNNHQVKVFHVEGFWGNTWDRTAGVIGSYVKMTPDGDGYRINDTTGYHNIGRSITTTSSGSFITGMSCDEYGMIPREFNGSSSTYFADQCWGGNGYLIAGGCVANVALSAGAFAYGVDSAPSATYWHAGCGLSCEQPASA